MRLWIKWQTTNPAMPSMTSLLISTLLEFSLDFLLLDLSSFWSVGHVWFAVAAAPAAVHQNAAKSQTMNPTQNANSTGLLFSWFFCSCSSSLWAQLVDYLFYSGLSKASTFKEGFSDLQCATAITFDDIVNGNVTKDGNNFFIGVNQLIT